eukprot:gene27623-7260_t
MSDSFFISLSSKRPQIRKAVGIKGSPWINDDDNIDKSLAAEAFAYDVARSLASDRQCNVAWFIEDGDKGDTSKCKAAVLKYRCCMVEDLTDGSLGDFEDAVWDVQEAAAAAYQLQGAALEAIVDAADAAAGNLKSAADQWKAADLEAIDVAGSAAHAIATAAASDVADTTAAKTSRAKAKKAKKARAAKAKAAAKESSEISFAVGSTEPSQSPPSMHADYEYVTVTASLAVDTTATWFCILTAAPSDGGGGEDDGEPVQKSPYSHNWLQRDDGPGRIADLVTEGEQTELKKDH